MNAKNTPGITDKERADKAEAACEAMRRALVLTAERYEHRDPDNQISYVCRRILRGEALDQDGKFWIPIDEAEQMASALRAALGQLDGWSDDATRALLAFQRVQERRAR